MNLAQIKLVERIGREAKLGQDERQDLVVRVLVALGRVESPSTKLIDEMVENGAREEARTLKKRSRAEAIELGVRQQELKDQLLTTGETAETLRTAVQRELQAERLPEFIAQLPRGAAW